MILSVSFNALAQAELRDAAIFYERILRGLGRRFVDLAQVALDDIAIHPLAAPVLQGEVRRKQIRGFPYQLLYRRTGATVRILAVMHTKRRPNYWVRRN